MGPNRPPLSNGQNPPPGNYYRPQTMRGDQTYSFQLSTSSSGVLVPFKNNQNQQQRPGGGGPQANNQFPAQNGPNDQQPQFGGAGNRPPTTPFNRPTLNGQISLFDQNQQQDFVAGGAERPSNSNNPQSPFMSTSNSQRFPGNGQFSQPQNFSPINPACPICLITISPPFVRQNGQFFPSNQAQPPSNQQHSNSRQNSPYQQQQFPSTNGNSGQFFPTNQGQQPDFASGNPARPSSSAYRPPNSQQQLGQTNNNNGQFRLTGSANQQSTSGRENFQLPPSDQRAIFDQESSGPFSYDALGQLRNRSGNVFMDQINQDLGRETSFGRENAIEDPRFAQTGGNAQNPSTNNFPSNSNQFNGQGQSSHDGNSFSTGFGGENAGGESAGFINGGQQPYATSIDGDSWINPNSYDADVAAGNTGGFGGQNLGQTTSYRQPTSIGPRQAVFAPRNLATTPHGPAIPGSSTVGARQAVIVPYRNNNNAN